MLGESAFTAMVETHGTAVTVTAFGETHAIGLTPEEVRSLERGVPIRKGCVVLRPMDETLVELRNVRPGVRAERRVLGIAPLARFGTAFLG